MKIACVDKTAADRLKLRDRVDEAFELCRSTLGHVRVAQAFPTSKAEVLIQHSPESIIIGPAYPIEESFAVLRSIRETHPNTPIVVILASELYSLHHLRRFGRYANEIFSAEESPTRFVHALSSFEEKIAREKSWGKLLVFSGVKGGVGTSSLLAGFAHAAEALGKSAAIIDLSPQAHLLHYVLAPEWQSTELADGLSEGGLPDVALIERALVSAPNGLTFLLPPAGGTETRELWLRDPKRLEYSIAIVDHLREMFDIVFVDLSFSEGLFPFALQTRADARILVTANEPAAVHLLNHKLLELTDIPGGASTHILLNMLSENSLQREDILAFLAQNKAFSPAMAALQPIPFDLKIKNWIGTGNTIYTEGNISLQRQLEFALRRLLSEETKLTRAPEPTSSSSPTLTLSPWKSLQNLLHSFSARQRTWIPPKRKLLPQETAESSLLLRPKKLSSDVEIALDSVNISTPLTIGCEPSRRDEPNFHYQKPHLALAQRGSLTLENLLFFAGAVALASLSLPTFFRHMGGYFFGFTE